MRNWLTLLSGFLLWTIHFFALYVVASAFPARSISYWLTGLFTVICLAVAPMLAGRLRRQNATSGMEGWVRLVALCGLGLSVVAIAWQGLPALIV